MSLPPASNILQTVLENLGFGVHCSVSELRK